MDRPGRLICMYVCVGTVFYPFELTYLPVVVLRMKVILKRPS
jgi:hypothetical protein